MDLLPKLADLGLTGIQFPEEYGGAALSAVDYCICIEELARVCPAIALSVAAHNGLCSAHIAMFGSDAQKQRYLPRLIRGEVLGAWGLTEAGAGSDAAGMRTTAVRDGDGWVLNGAKTFITHGRIGGVMVVIAVTDRARGHRGISAFVVEHGTPGMSAGQEGEQARDARQRHERGDLRPLPRHLGPAARRGRAGVHQHAAGARRRTDRHRRAVGRPGAGRLRGGAELRAGSGASSASRSPASRRSSGSSPTTRPASRRRGC